MALKRVSEHWRTREFHDFLVERDRMPFKWGSNDCALFAADGIKRFTNVDIAVDFRGKYTDAKSSLIAINKITGGRTVEDAAAYCAVKAGLEELSHPLTAQRGDLVVADRGDGEIIAGLIHLNGRHVVSVGEKGMIWFSIKNIKRAWRV